MFSKLRENFKNFTTPQDPVDKHVHDLVERCTSELLNGPDWALNMELVDLLNSDPRGKADSAIRALKTKLNVLNPKVQLLTLTTLETLAKNCSRAFHQRFAASELLPDMRKLVDETPTRKIDGQVRDKILGFIEDLARGLDYVQYRDTYEILLDHGVDFPVRPNEEQVIFFAAAHEQEPTAAMPGVPVGAAGLDLSGLSEEDRAAVAAAMADLEAGAAHPGQPAPPAAVASPRQPYPETHPPPARPASPAQGLPVGVPALPPTLTREAVQAQLETFTNSAGLLGEVLGGLPPSNPGAVHDAFITELFDQCQSSHTQLGMMIGGIADEEQMAAALAVNDDLQRVLDTYNDLVVKAAEGANLAAHTPTARHGAEAPFAGTNFTISEEDESADGGLATNRRPAPAPLLPPPVSTLAAPQPDLIDLGSADADAITLEGLGGGVQQSAANPSALPPLPHYPPIVTTSPPQSPKVSDATVPAAAEPTLLAPPAPPPVAASGTDHLVAELDQLMLTHRTSTDEKSHDKENN